MKRTLPEEILFVLIGFGYGIGIALLGFFSSGGGHVNIPAMLALSPFGLGIVFWPILGWLIPDLRSPAKRYTFLALMIAHYGGLILYIFITWNDEVRALGIAFSYLSFIAIFGLTLALYVIGQIVLWLAFIRSS